MNYICVFCGSSFGIRPAYRHAAQAMGTALVERGIGLVYGGGQVGLMGLVADTVMATGGEVIGVIPKFLAEKEIAHSGLTQLHLVDSMHERKALMADLADGFIALPGGYGTLEEFCEVLTWTQLGLHQKPHGLLNVEGYYDHLIRLFDHALSEEFVRPQHRSIVLTAATPEQLLDQFAAYRPQNVAKWVEDIKP
ncbi:TIGR00730 family Rossman fold protein [Leptolyngbya sp. NK1-12]|uniref:Cytokinin riboside 5'-monophosphate phosphoribohydrolase n=1 Tax=Leptolyngbya sp. NK1-12 TaxID=2547451 RepID=A0AA96WEX1_9CYAN|nr:TIGR00730 family Rossman fold protein [Leptolyngbya sp. NK1-12]WNZ23815.1 TIGR00730 family Rossman fold protein [Leptolyngbya sp. NK1-12]